MFKILLRLVRGKRGEYDRAMEIRRGVEEELQRRGIGLESRLIDSEALEEVVTPEIAAAYLLIGFNPVNNPEADEVMPSHAEEVSGRRDIFLRGGRLLRSAAFQISPEMAYQGSLIPSDAIEFGGASPNSFPPSYSETGRISLRNSVRHLIDARSPRVYELIADIAEPLHEMSGQMQGDYLSDIKLAIADDSPDLYQLAAAAREMRGVTCSQPPVKRVLKIERCLPIL